MTDRRFVAVAVSAAVLLSAAVLEGCGDSDSEPTAGTNSKADTPAASTATATRAWTRGHRIRSRCSVIRVRPARVPIPTSPASRSARTRGRPEATLRSTACIAHPRAQPGDRGSQRALFRGRATVDQLATQASTLLDTEPRPDLIVIQIMDNDLACPLEASALSHFTSSLTATPSKLFVVATEASAALSGPDMATTRCDHVSGACVASHVSPHEPHHRSTRSYPARCCFRLRLALLLG